MSDFAILVVDDEATFLKSMRFTLRDQGYRDVTLLSDPREALGLLEERQFALAFLDITMPGINGLELLEQIKQQSPSTECIMLTAHDSVPMVVKAMRLGAYDYLLKPLEPEQLHHAMGRALELHHLREMLRLRDQPKSELLDQPEAFAAFLTCETPVLQLLREAELHARSEIPVLITGETGTGKERLSRAIHQASHRAAGPFVAVNLLALSPGLFEPALFGHAKGAFTGATDSQPGFLAEAEGGTLFLDEIGDLPLEIQGKLLRVLQEKEYTPVGKTRSRRADVRFFAATHQDLELLSKQGKFRQDLYYRLRFAHLHLPPLRERPDDIRLLAHAFVGEASLSEPAMTALLRYSWPGNIRELKGALEAACNLADGHPIEPQHLRLPDLPLHAAAKAPPELLELEPLAEIERKHILSTYQTLHHNKTHTAKALGISLTTLHRKLKAYGQK